MLLEKPSINPLLMGGIFQRFLGLYCKVLMNVFLQFVFICYTHATQRFVCDMSREGFLCLLFCPGQ